MLDVATVRATVQALQAIVGPSSVIDIGSADDVWSEAFRAAQVAEATVVRSPIDQAWPGPKQSTVLADLREPLRLDRRFDLAVAIFAGDHLPSSAAPILVATLCGASDVVAFAAAMPGSCAPGTVNPRWPLWWDSLFEEQGYAPHDCLRPLLWETETVDLSIRQGLVLYAPPGRFPSTPLSPAAQRSIIHPETYHGALHRVEARRRGDATSATHRSLELEGRVLELVEQLRNLSAELEAERTAHLADDRPTADALAAEERRREQAEAELATEARDAALVRAALAAATREFRTAPAALLLSAAVRPGWGRCLVRSATAALPIRERFRRVIGPAVPLWDEAWYLTQASEVLQSSLSPVWHYRRHGARMGRSPHPWFDPSWYAHQNGEVVACGADAVEHYLERGWREGRDPHPLFDTRWYEREHASPDAWRGRSPLDHFLLRGRAAGCSPHPLFDVPSYLGGDPELSEMADDPAQHFLTRGWREGRDPHPLFDVRWYLAQNPDVADEGVNPLVHYLWFGWREGRDPHPLVATRWYLEAHPEAARSGLDPLRHYLVHGAAAGLSPGPLFDTSWYVHRFPEAVAHGQNPLAFFVKTGKDRGDPPSEQATGPGAEFEG